MDDPVLDWGQGGKCAASHREHKRERRDDVRIGGTASDDSHRGLSVDSSARCDQRGWHDANPGDAGKIA
jgi:hypothetical protein